jgi:uncharacterized protein YprB with RNaseH-like and TPR domain
MRDKINRDQFKNKLLFWDIETSLIELYAHRIGEQYVNHTQIKKDKKIICISYKAEGWKKTKTLYWDRNQDDRTMLEKFVKIAQKYPVLVGQNGDAFDLKTFKGRLWQEQLSPLTNILTLDTLKMSRQNFKLTSHKLDYKSKVIGGDGKLRIEFRDWVDIQEKKISPRTKMGPYNKIDVEELQEVFWSMVPYCDKLPIPLATLITDDRLVCRDCASEKVKQDGLSPSSVGFKQRWYCGTCGFRWTDTRLKTTTDKLLAKKRGEKK